VYVTVSATWSVAVNNATPFASVDCVAGDGDSAEPPLPAAIVTLLPISGWPFASFNVTVSTALAAPSDGRLAGAPMNVDAVGEATGADTVSVTVVDVMPQYVAVIACDPGVSVVDNLAEPPDSTPVPSTVPASKNVTEPAGVPASETAAVSAT